VVGRVHGGSCALAAGKAMSVDAMISTESRSGIGIVQILLFLVFRVLLIIFFLYSFLSNVAAYVL
jgi:hypothetical protein